MISHVSELENLNTVHITILPETIYRFIIPIKIPTAFFAEIKKVILKFITTCKGYQTAKTIKKKNKVARFR